MLNGIVLLLSQLFSGSERERGATKPRLMGVEHIFIFIFIFLHGWRLLPHRSLLLPRNATAPSRDCAEPHSLNAWNPGYWDTVAEFLKVGKTPRLG